MRRPLLLGLCFAWSSLAAAAACSSFSSDESAAEAGAAETGSALDGALDVVTKPAATCPLVPTKAPCTTGCEEALPPLPPSPLTPVNEHARIAVHGDTVYVARIVAESSAELFSKAAAAADWTFRGEFPASLVFGIGVNDTTILLSLRGGKLSDGAPANQQLVELDIGCDGACTGKTTTVPSSTFALPGVVTIGQNFYLSSAGSVLALKGGNLTSVSPTIFGEPVVAADCTYVYYSSVFDKDVHRIDVASGGTGVIASNVGLFDASAEAGAFPGTAGLAAANDRVFAMTGSRQLYAMPNNPMRPAPEVIVSDAALGQPIIVADGRFVYYGEGDGVSSSVIIRIAPDGGGRQQLSSGAKRIADIASDADHLYIVDTGGQVTRLNK